MFTEPKIKKKKEKILITNDILFYEPCAPDIRVIILVYGFRTYDKWQYFTKILYG